MAAARTAAAARRAAPARTTGAARRAPARSTPRRGAPPRVRWDRLGRIALLLVLAGVLYLYVSPVRSYVSALQEAKAKRAEVARLAEQNARLRARRKALGDPRTLEREARALGMVRPGERAYVIENLPRGG